MSYCGGMIAGKENLSRKCSSFLKQCLRNTPLEFPVRGPMNYEKENLDMKTHGREIWRIN